MGGVVMEARLWRQPLNRMGARGRNARRSRLRGRMGDTAGTRWEHGANRMEHSAMYANMGRTWCVMGPRMGGGVESHGGPPPVPNRTRMEPGGLGAPRAQWGPAWERLAKRMGAEWDDYCRETLQRHDGGSMETISRNRMGAEWEHCQKTNRRRTGNEWGHELSDTQCSVT